MDSSHICRCVYMLQLRFLEVSQLRFSPRVIVTDTKYKYHKLSDTEEILNNKINEKYNQDDLRYKDVVFRFLKTLEQSSLSDAEKVQCLVVNIHVSFGQMKVVLLISTVNFM